jgi:RNA polymerase sigma-70 factor (ECF subfamily)
VIVLHYFTECSYRQIGEILDLPEKTVKSRLFSARQQLKNRLQEHGVFHT